MDTFLGNLVRRGWTLEARSDGAAVDAAALRGASEELRRFLCSYQTLTNAAETRWLNAADDFGRTPASGFAWNEFERIALAAAEGDDAWIRDVQAFWSMHLPILMSVGNRYEYVAYCTAGTHAGAYVHGAEPEFDDVTVVATSLDGFKTWVLSNVV